MVRDTDEHDTLDVLLDLIGRSQDDPDSLDEHEVRMLGGAARDWRHELHKESLFPHDQSTEHFADISRMVEEENLTKSEAIDKLVDSLRGYLEFLIVTGNKKVLIKTWVDEEIQPPEDVYRLDP